MNEIRPVGNLDVVRGLARQLEESERRCIELLQEKVELELRTDKHVRSVVAAADQSTTQAEGGADNFGEREGPANVENAEAIERLQRELQIALQDSLDARGKAAAAARQRDRVLLKIKALRTALEAVGLESQVLREMNESLANKYALLARSNYSAGRRSLLGHVERFFRRFSGSRIRNAQEHEDAETLRHSIFFDEQWYLSTYPDVSAEEFDSAVHYLRHGAQEMRDPGPWFSTREYLNNNPDVATAGANPLLHFIRHGAAEGRATKAAPTLAAPTRQHREAVDGRRSCLVVSGEPESAGHRYRVLRLVGALRGCDVDSSWVRADDLSHRQEQICANDIVVFWRVAWSDQVAETISALKAAQRTIVFDVDDLMTEPELAKLEFIDGIRTASLTEEVVGEHYARIRRVMIEADVCVTTTEELAFHLRWAGKTTHVIPNGFDQQTHALSRLERRRWLARDSDGLVRIGYPGGSHTHQQDFAQAAEGIAQLLKERPHCRLVLFRSPAGPLLDPEEFEAFGGLEDQIEWRSAVPLPELPRELARFDINIAPLEVGNPYCEAKSELKYFEAALVDVPTVASPTGPFRRAIVSGKTGLLALTADDWYHCLSELVGDADARHRMGRAAYHDSLAKFGPEMRSLRIGCVFDQLSGGSAAGRGFALGCQLAARTAPPLHIYPSTVIFRSDNLEAASVTVVVPSYNYERFIEETLDSVAAQTAPVLDLVIVDGHSTDNSLEVASRWAKRNADRFNRITVLQNDANYGLGYCRNSGVDAAETPYVLFLDADNQLLPTACEDLVERLQSTGAAFAYPILQHFGASDAQIGTAPFEAQRFAAGNYVDAMALVSKEAWAAVGGIHHVKSGWEDYDFWCRIAELGLRGEWVDKVLGRYRVHPTSMQTTQTTVPENYRRLMRDFKSRHPWTSLIDQEQSRQLPAANVSITPAQEQTRLDAILPILRCPMTHQKLGYDKCGENLVSFDGLQSWPIVDGRPVLTHAIPDPIIHPVKHLSNNLSVAATELIESCSGWVLNLSAGGTAKRYDHVVEVEYSLFRNTDLVADAHSLPFADGSFEAVVVLNAFEHYRDPKLVAAELHRILRPGGRILVATAFLQPIHEKPWHYYNCTRYGLQEWFRDFDEDSLMVTDNFSPNFTLGWIAAEAELALRAELGEDAAEALKKANLGSFIRGYRNPSADKARVWHSINELSESARETISAGFEYCGRKPDDVSVVQ